ncbi:hypothetical protein lbkm_0694 [Lachnospiraceae bacterium KM106-2]|nr:hypothetical protein lbkm_0694 [Lachnospiraceae bacterium KM106-2]
MVHSVNKLSKKKPKIKGIAVKHELAGVMAIDLDIVKHKKKKKKKSSSKSRIGNWGKDIVFETSDKKILTFNDFNQKVSARWSNHERIGKKPLSEFMGPDLRSITFNIVLSATLGVKPRKTMDKIEKCVQKGKVNSLVIGGKKIGKNKWKITSVNEKWDFVYARGLLAKATLSLTMEEYV